MLKALDDAKKSARICFHILASRGLEKDQFADILILFGCLICSVVSCPLDDQSATEASIWGQKARVNFYTSCGPAFARRGRRSFLFAGICEIISAQIDELESRPLLSN